MERAGKVKRFLSPQVAEAVLNSDSLDPFQTRRREVTVVFIDLCGFTNFSDGNEPEEVMQVLRNYHEEVGRLIFKYEGTLEHFAGDGIMVFFNDPIPRDDHTVLATQMSIEVQDRINEIRPEWHKKGYELDVGIGISTGFATLGTIGFEGRMDYAAIGNVTILAAKTYLAGISACGLVLINTLRKNGPRLQWIGDALVRSVAVGGLELFRDLFLPLLMNEEWQRENRKSFIKEPPSYQPLSQNHGHYKLLSAAGRSSDWDVHYENLDLPCLVVTGLQDHVFLELDVVDELCSRLPKMKRLDVLEAGHLLPAEVPGELISSLAAFAQEVE